MSKKTIVQTTTNLFLRVHVRPNAKINAIREVNGCNDIRVDIAADAQDGKANQQLMDYMRSILKLSSEQLELVRGHKHREKLLRLIITTDQQDQLIEYLRNEITSK